MKAQRIWLGFLLLGLSLLLLSCGRSGPTLDDQAKNLLTLIQNKNYDKCVELSQLYYFNMQKYKDQPQFKQKEMALRVASDTRNELFNEIRPQSIAYLFRFPCQWQLVEHLETTIEVGDGQFTQTVPVYRVFGVVKYQAMEQSPEAAPLVVKPEEINYNNYKVKEIVFHVDLDPGTGWYMGWGTHKHVPW